MKQSLFLFLFLFLFGIHFFWAQGISRQLINGQISVTNNDVEGISVYNTSTNKGTITNTEGEFAIEAGLNDNLEISALQFAKRTIIVNASIFKNKTIKITLVEAINALDEVTILPYKLTGNINEDVQTSEIIAPFTFSYVTFNDYEFSDDNKSAVKNIAVNNVTYENGLNVVNIFSELIKPLFKNKNKKTDKSNDSQLSSVTSLSNVYTLHFLSKSFNIPEEKAGLFIEYVEENGLTEALLREGNELKLIAFLHEKSKHYLLELSDKN